MVSQPRQPWELAENSWPLQVAGVFCSMGLSWLPFLRLWASAGFSIKSGRRAVNSSQVFASVWDVLSTALSLASIWSQRAFVLSSSKYCRLTPSTHHILLTELALLRLPCTGRLCGPRECSAGFGEGRPVHPHSDPQRCWPRARDLQGNVCRRLRVQGQPGREHGAGVSGVWGHVGAMSELCPLACSPTPRTAWS